MASVSISVTLFTYLLQFSKVTFLLDYSFIMNPLAFHGRLIQLDIGRVG